MDKDFKLGYCPTMGQIARELANKNNGISLVPMGSAAEALYYLKADQTGGALIGRIAKATEITPDTKKINIQKEGYTFISWRKSFINKSDLPNLSVVTYLPELIVKDIIPEVKQVMPVDSEEEMVNHMNDHAGFIPWSSYKDKYELLIPMEDGVKMIRFRLPVIYFKDRNEEVVLSLTQ